MLVGCGGDSVPTAVPSPLPLSPQDWTQWGQNPRHDGQIGVAGQRLDRSTCVDDHPNGFEWCINAPAVDANGLVYANNEDGALFVIGQGGVMRQSIFLDSALSAAYTPVSMGRDGRIYTQNNGRLFVVGN